LAGQNRISLAAFVVFLIRILGARRDPGAEVVIVLDCRVKHRDRLVSFLFLIFVRRLFQHVLISFDRLSGFLNIVGLVDTGFVLLVGNASDKNRGGLVAGIKSQRAFGMLLGVVEMAFLIALGRLVQLILRPDFVDQPAA